MLCDDGRASSIDQAIHLQNLIWKAIASGRHVAIINSITWGSSKVRLFINHHDELTDPYRCLCHC
jgi:hypothetical protein